MTAPRLSTGPIRALPDSAPQPEGERIQYAFEDSGELLVDVVCDVLRNFRLVWWRGNFYAVERKL